MDAFVKIPRHVDQEAGGRRQEAGAGAGAGAGSSLRRLTLTLGIQRGGHPCHSKGVGTRNGISVLHEWGAPGDLSNSETVRRRDPKRTVLVAGGSAGEGRQQAAGREKVKEGGRREGENEKWGGDGFLYENNQSATSYALVTLRLLKDDGTHSPMNVLRQIGAGATSGAIGAVRETIGCRYLIQHPRVPAADCPPLQATGHVQDRQEQWGLYQFRSILSGN
eukprot:750443-Hanusia_phi.AAC.3